MQKKKGELYIFFLSASLIIHKSGTKGSNNKYNPATESNATKQGEVDILPHCFADYLSTNLK